MEIDYELVEKIGATHYGERCNSYYKLHPLKLLYVYVNGEWGHSSVDNAYCVRYIKPIPPKPQMRIEYERVEFSLLSEVVIFIENGNDLYTKGDNWRLVGGMHDAIRRYGLSQSFYRRIEKPVDWREEASEYLAKCRQLTDSCDLSLCTSKPNSDDPNDLHEWVELQSEFLEMCHIALKASGRI